MAKLNNISFCLALHLVFLNAVCSPYEITKSTTDKKLLFVFGDSLFDAGNNQYIPNDSFFPPVHYPYGFTYFTNATGRCSDGMVVPDFISEFANLGLLEPTLAPDGNFVNGANFASTGAYVLDRSHTKAQLNLVDQLSNFTDLVAAMRATRGDEQTKEVLVDSVYLFSFGGNDYVEFYTEYEENGVVPTLAQKEAYVKDVIGNLSAGIIEIYGYGGRKFAFQNVGPIGCVPSKRESNGSCIELLLELPRMNNKLFNEALETMAQNLIGFKYSIHDYYNSLLDRIQNPSSYGFLSGTVACCGYDDYPFRGDGCGTTNASLCPYPSAYLFWDGDHTTQRGNFQIAQLIWNGSEPLTWPYNVKQLFTDVSSKNEDKDFM